MNFLTIFFLLVTTAPHHAEFNKAIQLFSKHYNEPVFTGEVNNDNIFPIGGPEAIFLKPMGGKDSLVIGDTPGETLFISGTYSIPMDIYIINDGVVLVKNADLSIKGNITLTNHGKFDCDSSQIHFLQDYIYEFTMFIQDSADFTIKNSSTTFNYFPINLLTIGDAHLIWKNLDNRDWTTAVVMGNSIDSLDNVNIAGEWLLSDRTITSFRNTDTLLVWFFFPDSSVVDFTFPNGDTLNGFVFDSTLANVSGIPYCTEIDNCHGVMWGMIPLAGSNVTLNNSKIRTTGLMFSSDSSAVSGLVNGLTYTDFTLPLTDRTYHLINTYVNTWSFYPADTSYLEISSSIFGECVGMGNCNYLIQNAFCDGSGGHIETTDNAFGMIFLSSLTCDVITKGRSILVIGYSSVLLGNIWATGSSIMLLVNSSIPDVPQALDTSIIFIDAVTGPSTASTYEIVPVSGSATILSGPFQPGGFDNYSLFYRVLGESIWTPFDSTHYTPVYNGTLGLWNTDTLQPDYYELRCLLIDTYGDSIEATKQVNLLPGGVALKKGTGNADIPFLLYVNRKLLSITNLNSIGRLELYDVAGRRMMYKMVKKGDEVVWSLKRSGVYFVRLKTNSGAFVRKAVIF